MSERQPALRPTEPATLVVAALAAAGVAWLSISNFYQDLPPMIWPPVVVIGGVAALEAAVARNLWIRIQTPGRVTAGRRGQAGGEPVDPLAVARYAVLAKASSLAGAILTGAYAGFLPWLLIESRRLPAAGAELPPAIGGLLASIALMVVGLLLERACRVPEPPDEPPDQPPDQPAGDER